MSEPLDDEFSYQADQMGVDLWMITRTWECGYEEAMVTIDTNDPAVATQAAIERGSWA
jgi:hypothetical protein